MMNASFHFPLHRYLAAFVCQAVRTMSMPLKDILPTPDILTLLMMHPLRVQVSKIILIQFYIHSSFIVGYILSYNEHSYLT